MRTIVLLAAAIVIIADVASAEAPGPISVQVPGAFEKAAPGLAAHDGFVWYRCYVVPPARWASFVEGEKNLWAESVRLRIEGVRDPYEVYVNGQKIGGAGELGPDAKPIDPIERRHKVTPGLMKADTFNTVALRVYNPAGEGGLLGPAPIMGGYYDEFVLEGPWELVVGDDARWAQGPVKERPKVGVFDEPVESSSVLSRPDEWRGGPRLAPEAALAKLTAADDLVAEQVLTEPLVAQPVHMSFDERGRLWVVQFRQYPYPAGVKMISRDKYYRAVYDRVPPAPPNHDRGEDRITIHEDTDGDGTFDKHAVFMDGLNICNSVERGRGGVWVLHPPHLLFVPDADGDDKPDGDPVVHLTGFGIEDTHSIANGLRWGPDGWLYIAQGSTVASRVRRPDSNDEPIYAESTCIWRYHPETGRVEVFAVGGNNQLGIEFDNAGRLFTGTNTGATRGHHYVQGGYYPKGAMSKFGPTANPHSYGQLPLMKHDASTPRFSHCFAKYEAEGLPPRYRGRVFATDPLQRQIVASTMTVDGSTFQTGDDLTVLASDDPGFRPVDIKVGPDGAVYVADFYEFYIAHGQHYQGQIDPTTGRVYRLRAKDAAPPKRIDLSGRSTDELIDLLTHEQKWVRQTALRLIGDRRDTNAVARLRRMLAEHDDDRALGALWALNLSGGFDDEIAADLLGHASADVRRWTVRLLGDGRGVSDAVAARLAERAQTEPDPGVRCQLDASARRLDTRHTLPIVRALTTHAEDTADPFIPLMIWWALEARCETDAAAIVALFDKPKTWGLPLIRSHVTERLMRRLAATGKRSNLTLCARLLNAAPSKEDAARLMTGFELAYQGRSMRTLPPELASALEKAGGGSLMLRVRRGDADAVAEALRIIGDKTADAERRRQLIDLFAEIDSDGAVDALLPLVNADNDPALVRSALTALLRHDEQRIAETVADVLPTLDESAQPVAITLLASRTDSSANLLEAVDAGRIDRKLVHADAVETMRRHEHDDVRAAVTRLFPAESPADADAARAEIARLQQAVADKPGSPYKGLELFNARCAACHTLHGKGGSIGPDLTTYQRDDLPSMLASIVTPSAEVREGFESFIVTTKDGRVLNGFLVDQDAHVVVLRGVDGQDVSIEREALASMNGLGRSLMPPGLLAGLDDQQVRDLIAYLRTAQPLSD